MEDQVLQPEEEKTNPDIETTPVDAPETAPAVSVAPDAGAEIEAEVKAPAPAVSESFDDEEPEVPAAPLGPQRHWYVVHCYSGYENKVKKGLEQRIGSMGMQEFIFQAIVPTEEELDMREGQRKVIQRRVFPGYILVEMKMTEESWYVVRNTPGVTGFVSSGDKPTPLREDEVTKIIKRMQADQPKVRVTYRPGQVVHIIEGPFADFRGTVDEVNMEKGKVRVMVSFFGRETPVELDLLQVEKV